MQTVSIKGVNIHYEDAGGERPALVFANSLGTDFRIWDGVVERLSGKWRCIRYDKRGHGLSDTPHGPYTLNDNVDDLAGLLEHLGIGTFVMAGVSIGGLITMGIAARFPDRVRAAIICDSMPRIGPPSMWDERIAAIRKGGITALSDAVLERWFPPEFRNRADSGFPAYRNMLERMPLEGYLATCAALRDADYTDEARRLAMPVLFLVGSQDGSTTPEAVRAAHNLVPGSQFHIIEASGHLPCVDAPEKTAGHMTRFLEEHSIG